MFFILWILSLITIWSVWGFWAMVWTFIGELVISAMSKPKYSWEPHWGRVIAQLGVSALAFIAITTLGEPAYTAAAAVIIVVLVAMGLKS